MAKSKKKVSMPASVRNKLLAAVSMLMVSAIMLVSSTYAWFTLSTAPEVKNISTTVVGNGSLEIALMPADGKLGSIKSGFSSSENGGTTAVTTANTTWGNIINLSDASYGLSDVDLNPARLNTVSSGDAEGNVVETFKDASKPLVIATYGYDGRIDEIKENTVLRSRRSTDLLADPVTDFSQNGYGVRAIGDAGGTGTLGDTYGYVVDLAFRLNTTNNTTAADGTTTTTAGKLLLQTDALQRIYNGTDYTDDNAPTNTETMGGGSYMSFNANGTGMSEKTIKSLLEAVRVTFVQDYGKSTSTDGTTTVADTIVLGTARLNTGKLTIGATDTQAPLYLCDETGAFITTQADAVLVEEMEKNAAVQVSAIVWLDGDMVTNASVASVSSTLAQLTLNLQFSTDVALKPAENNVLIEGSAE